MPRSLSDNYAPRQAAEERALAGREDVSLRERDPVALQPQGVGTIAGVVLMADPPLRRLLVQAELEDVPMLQLRPVGRHVVVELAQLPDDPHAAKAGLLNRLPCCRLLG